MRVAITGATGNIGTATLRRPAPDGHHIVDAGRQGAHCSQRVDRPRQAGNRRQPKPAPSRDAGRGRVAHRATGSGRHGTPGSGGGSWSGGGLAVPTCGPTLERRCRDRAALYPTRASPRCLQIRLNLSTVRLCAPRWRPSRWPPPGTFRARTSRASPSSRTGNRWSPWPRPNPLAERADTLQVRLRAGPCYAALPSDRFVLVNDSAADTTFPRHSRCATSLGIRARAAVHLVDGKDRAGHHLHACTTAVSDHATAQFAELLATRAGSLLGYAEQVGQLGEARTPGRTSGSRSAS